MDFEDIPEVLFSSIKEDDPYRGSKLLQIERWCYAHWDLITKIGKKWYNFLAQVLSSEDCWESVNNLHGVKLNRQIVGKKLITPPDSDNPFSREGRYQIACECCLEDDIRAIFEERKRELFAQGRSHLLEYNYLVKCCGEGPLAQFLSHFISGYTSKLDLKGRHPYEYGLNCAIGWQQVEGVEFLWNKIKSLPENEMSAKKKDEILIKCAVYTAGPSFRIYPDIFEFFLNQLDHDRYPELLKRDLEKNTHYASLYRMLEMFNFDKFQKLFDFLKPCNIPEKTYTIWLKLMVKDCPENYSSAGVGIFIHVWTREGFDGHRTLTLNEEMMNYSVFQGRILVPLVHKGYMEPVWAILDKADSNQIKEFMSSKKADHICSVLEQRDDNSLNKFSSYCVSAVKNLDEERM